MNIQIGSYFDHVVFQDDKVVASVILETEYCKELRIAMKSGQKMKDHKTPYPITVQVLKGTIDFGVSEKDYILKSGDIIALEGNIPHHLVALEDSIVRLTLSKADQAQRVQQVIGE